jgi:hypothetical protein
MYFYVKVQKMIVVHKIDHQPELVHVMEIICVTNEHMSVMINGQTTSYERATGQHIKGKNNCGQKFERYR